MSSTNKEQNLSGNTLIVDKITELGANSSNKTNYVAQRTNAIFLQKDTTKLKAQVATITDDGIITTKEKVTLKASWEAIHSQFSISTTKAEEYGIEEQSVYLNYETSFQALSTGIVPVFSDMSTNYTIPNGIDITSLFSDYYTKENLLSEVLFQYETGILNGLDDRVNTQLYISSSNGISLATGDTTLSVKVERNEVDITDDEDIGLLTTDFTWGRMEDGWTREGETGKTLSISQSDLYNDTGTFVCLFKHYYNATMYWSASQFISLVKTTVGTGISSITEQYYLSTSKTEQLDGEWLDVAPTWTTGKYMWTRSKIVYNNPSSEEYTTPIVDSSWEVANDVQENLDTYITSTDSTINSLQNQVDGKVDSWFENYSPTLETYPSSEWTTDELKARHVGDTFTNTQEYVDEATTPDAGKSWRFIENGGVYTWTAIADSDAVRALLLASTAQDTADNKRRVFTVTPTPPYDVGDLWVQGEDGDLLRCQTAKADGTSYSSDDWVKASKYTDDTAVDDLSEVVDKTVKSTDVEYYLSSSTTELLDGEWLTIAPTWIDGMYMWSRTKTTLNDDTFGYSPSETGTCIAGATGATGPQGLQGIQGLQGETGEQGIQGETGADGLSAYSHIAYADDDSGTGFSQEPTGKEYIGFYSDNTEDDSTDPNDYKWSLIKGADGEQGIQGPTGEDGLTSYFHTAWANSADGITDFSTTISTDRTYIGTYSDHEEDDSLTESDYNWVLIKGSDGADAPLTPYQLTIYSSGISDTPDDTTLSDPIPTDEGWSQTIPTRTVDDIIYVSTATVEVNDDATAYKDTIEWSTPVVYLTTDAILQLQIEYEPPADDESEGVVHIIGSNEVDQSDKAKIKYKRQSYTIFANDITATIDKYCYIALVSDYVLNSATLNTKIVYSFAENIEGTDTLKWLDLTDDSVVADTDIICLIGRVTPGFDETFAYGKSTQEVLESDFMQVLSDASSIANVDLNVWARAMGVTKLVENIAVLKAFVDQLIVNHVSLTENGSIDSLSDDEKTKFHVTKDKIEIKNADIENIIAKNATVDNIIATALKTYNNVSASSGPVVCPSADYWKRTDLEALCPNANQIYNLDTSHNTYDTKTYKYLIRSTGSSVNFASYTFAGTNHTTYSSSFSVKTGGNYSFSLKLPHTIDRYETEETATCTVTSSYGTASASNPAHPSRATPHNGNVRYSDGSTTHTKSLSPGQTVTFDGYVVSTSAPYYTWTEEHSRNKYPTCTVTSSVGGFSKSVTSTMSTKNWVWENIATDTNITVKIEWLNGYYNDDEVDGFFTAKQTYENGLLLYATDSTKTKIANNKSYSNESFDLTVGTINKNSTSLKIYVGLKDYIATLRGSNDSIVIPCQYQNSQSAITSYYGISPTKNGVDTVSVTTTTLAFYKEGILKATYSTSDYIENFISQIVKITANIRIVTQEIMPDSNGVRDVGSTSNQFRDVYANRFHGIVYGAVFN